MTESGPEPIGGYGLVGDTRTAALVSAGGSVDWLCTPRFDGDPLFARLVAGPGGGCFEVAPADARAFAPPTRRYLPGTPVLETTWRVDGVVVTAFDAMVAEVAGTLLPTTLLVRRVEVRGGAAWARVRFDPRRGDGRTPPRSSATRRGALVCAWRDVAVALRASAEVVAGTRPGAEVDVEVTSDRPLTLALSVAHRQPLVDVAPEAAWDAVLRDADRWRAWTAGIGDVPFRPAVARSLLTLRLLTYSPSGAPVAAPTTSLPEAVGGGRNWDYRYAWPRDAAIGVAAFLATGMAPQARSFLYWLLHASRLDRPRLRPVLTLDGRPVPPEREVPGWAGYAGSRPVRVGNGARGQHQLDVYGWVLDAAWLMERDGERLYGETWRAMAGAADHVVRCWRGPDAGMWEVRGAPAHYVHSKLMAWLALDRALCLADRHRVRAARRACWSAARDALAADIRARGFDPDRQCYTRSYGSADLDAATLLLPVLGFDPPAAPSVSGTVDAVRRELSAGGPLLYRYPPEGDGLHGGEGAFLPCSFWLVQALALTGRADEAVELFEALLGYGGPLGLFAEQVDPATGALLGNYPQALSHAALVQAALAVRDVTTGAAAGPGRRRTRHGRPAPPSGSPVRS